MSAYCSTIEDEPFEIDLVYEQLWLTQQILKARAEEIKCAYAEIESLKADLAECREFLEPFVDVIDGDYGEPAPNKAMRLVTMIDASLDGAF